MCWDVGKNPRRTAFETWAKDRLHPITRLKNGNYAVGSTRVAWNAWQAATEAAIERANSKGLKNENP